MKLGCSSRLLLIAAILVFVVLAVDLALGAIGSSFLGRQPFTAAPKPELPAEVVAQAGPIPITNTMVAAWVTTIVLVVVFVVGTRKMKLVPKGLQNLVEFASESLLNFVEGVVGKENGRRLFPMIATIFLFVMTNAWLGLVPGFGSFGVVEQHEGEAIVVPLLRAANTDLNVTLALALVSFVFVEYLGVSRHGFFRYAAKFVNVKPLLQALGKIFTGKLKAGLSGVFMGGIQAFVGIIETVSEFVRIVSFTFRLFGNMLAGEIVLLIMFFLVPFVIPVVFYSLELLVGLIQALIFGGLTLVFASMAMAEHEHP